MPDIQLLVPTRWWELRDIRLRALGDSPDSFLAAYDDEFAFEEEDWLAEFQRGEWSIGFRDQKPISLLGATREVDTPPEQCYLGYMWVAPQYRRNGFGLHTLNVVIDRLRTSGIRTILLWVLSTNKVAERLYQNAGFVSADRSQPIKGSDGLTEELMRLIL